MLLRTTQQLEEWETLGPNWSLMHIPFPFENVVFFYQHYLSHHEY